MHQFRFCRTLADETVNNAPNQAPVTYEVVEGGSERGYSKLVSSNGYAFVKKRTLANGTIDWRCSVRSKGSGCPATIKQFQNTFRVAGGSHNHQAKPGLVTAIKVKKEVRNETDLAIFFIIFLQLYTSIPNLKYFFSD